MKCYIIVNNIISNCFLMWKHVWVNLTSTWAVNVGGISTDTTVEADMELPVVSLGRSLREYDSTGLMVKSIAKWVLSVFPQEYYNKGDYIIREGEEGNTFYVIANGKVICNILSSKKHFRQWNTNIFKMSLMCLSSMIIIDFLLPRNF